MLLGRMRRSAFFISDSTGITAETLGHALLTQFEQVEYRETTLPFIDDAEKMEAAVNMINRAVTQDGCRPLVFATLTDLSLLETLRHSNALVLDMFNVFLPSLEGELGSASSHATGRSHAVADKTSYDSRIAAVNFALQHDDGVSTRRYQDADVILVGVSRTGKTPTCLYMALRFGLRAANYPLTEEDLRKLSTPRPLCHVKGRIYGLTIDAERLHQIRTQRHPDSNYASLAQCQGEVQAAEELFQAERIPFLCTTTLSIEEIASRILQALGIKRRLF